MEQKPAVRPEVAAAAQKARERETNQNVIDRINRIEKANIIVPDNKRLVSTAMLEGEISPDERKPMEETEDGKQQYYQDYNWTPKVGPELRASEHIGTKGEEGPVVGISNVVITMKRAILNENLDLVGAIDYVYVVDENTQGKITSPSQIKLVGSYEIK